MTNQRRSARVGAALVIALWIAFCGGSSIAEVSTDPAGDSRVHTLLMDSATGITDGADPVPTVTWQPYRPLGPHRMLNPSGVIRPDGRPHVVFAPVTRWPLVVWAYNNGSDHDIAVSEWNGSSWTATRFLTSSAADELDPRAHIAADGRVYVTWWVNETAPFVMLVQRSPETLLWSAPLRVNPDGQHARMPSVARFAGAVRVAYERVIDTGTTSAPGELLVRRLDEDGPGFVVEHTASAVRSAGLDASIEVEGSRRWMTWKHSETEFASCIYQSGAWGATTLHPWGDSSWIGVEAVRLEIRRAVIAQFDSIPPTGTDP